MRVPIDGIIQLVSRRNLPFCQQFFETHERPLRRSKQWIEAIQEDRIDCQQHIDIDLLCECDEHRQLLL